MSSFTDHLSTTQISIKPRRWRLDRDLKYFIGHEDSDVWVMVLKGFICDGGSIPRIVWAVDSPNGDGAAAYFLHDLMYGAEVGDRLFCDAVMLEALKVLGMGWTRRRAIYYPVRLGGWAAWNAHTPDSIAETRQFCIVSPNLESYLLEGPRR